MNLKKISIKLKKIAELAQAFLNLQEPYKKYPSLNIPNSPKNFLGFNISTPMHV